MQVAGIWERERERIGPCPERTAGEGKMGQTCGLLSPRRGTCGMGSETLSLGSAPRWKPTFRHLVFGETLFSD